MINIGILESTLGNQDSHGNLKIHIENLVSLFQSTEILQFTLQSQGPHRNPTIHPTILGIYSRIQGSILKSQDLHWNCRIHTIVPRFHTYHMLHTVVQNQGWNLRIHTVIPRVKLESKVQHWNIKIHIVTLRSTSHSQIHSEILRSTQQS